MITVNKEFIAVPMSFSGGEVQADTKALMTILDDEYNGNTDDIRITANIKDSDDIFALLQIKEAIDNLLLSRPEINVHLKMPYLPYARYDRRMHLTDSFSLKDVSNKLKSLNMFTSSFANFKGYIFGIACGQGSYPWWIKEEDAFTELTENKQFDNKEQIDLF
jgi:hypothetical protein